MMIRSADVVVKHVHGSEGKLTGVKTWSVVQVVMILNFLEFESSCLKKCKMMNI